MDSDLIIRFLHKLSISLTSLGMEKTAGQINSLLKDGNTQNGYVIARTNCNQFWSSDLGWSSLEEADVYNKENIKSIKLPADGNWIKVDL